MCLDHKFSAKAWMKLLQIYAKEGNTQKALLAAVKLTVYHERWYHEIVVCFTGYCRHDKIIDFFFGCYSIPQKFHAI